MYESSNEELNLDEVEKMLSSSYNSKDRETANEEKSNLDSSDDATTVSTLNTEDNSPNIFKSIAKIKSESKHNLDECSTCSTCSFHYDKDTIEEVKRGYGDKIIPKLNTKVYDNDSESNNLTEISNTSIDSSNGLSRNLDHNDSLNNVIDEEVTNSDDSDADTLLSPMSKSGNNFGDTKLSGLNKSLKLSSRIDSFNSIEWAIRENGNTIQEHIQKWNEHVGSNIISAPDNKGHSILLHALVDADDVLFDGLLNYDIKIEQTDSKNRDIVYFACYYLRGSFLKKLYQNNPISVIRMIKNKKDLIDIIIKGNELLETYDLDEFITCREWEKTHKLSYTKTIKSVDDKKKLKNIIIDEMIQCLDVIFQVNHSLKKVPDNTYGKIRSRIGNEIDHRIRKRNWFYTKLVLFTLYIMLNYLTFFLFVYLSNTGSTTKWVIVIVIAFFSIQLASKIILAGLFRISYKSSPNKETPNKVCCMVPVYNENPRNIGQTIESILQEYRKCIPSGSSKIVIIIDDYNTKVRDSLLKTYLSDYETKIIRRNALNLRKYPDEKIYCYNGIYSFGVYQVKIEIIIKDKNRSKRDSQLIFLNLLPKMEEKYDNIMFVDSDTTLKEDTIKNALVKLNQDENHLAVCGTTDIKHPKTSMEHYQVYEYKQFHLIGKGFEASSPNNLVTCLPGCFVIFRSEVFTADIINKYSKDPFNNKFYGRWHWLRQIYDTTLIILGEDRYLTTLILMSYLRKSTNKSILYISDAVVETSPPNSVITYIRQRRRWINSTISNIIKLIGTSKMMIHKTLLWVNLVFDLIGSILAPSGTIFFIYLVILTIKNTLNSTNNWSATISVITSLLSFIVTFFFVWLTYGASIMDPIRQLLYLPITGILMPLYSMWNIDDISWGTRIKTNRNNDARLIGLSFLSYSVIGTMIYFFSKYTNYICALCFNNPWNIGITLGIPFFMFILSVIFWICIKPVSKSRIIQRAQGKFNKSNKVKPIEVSVHNNSIKDKSTESFHNLCK